MEVPCPVQQSPLNPPFPCRGIAPHIADIKQSLQGKNPFLPRLCPIIAHNHQPENSLSDFSKNWTETDAELTLQALNPAVNLRRNR
jgi:hypothetical protein